MQCHFILQFSKYIDEFDQRAVICNKNLYPPPHLFSFRRVSRIDHGTRMNNSLKRGINEWDMPAEVAFLKPFKFCILMMVKY